MYSFTPPRLGERGKGKKHIFFSWISMFPWYWANSKHRRIIWPLFGFWILRTCVLDQSYRVISMNLFQPLWKKSPSVSSLSQSWALVHHLSKLWNLDDNVDGWRGDFHEIATLPTSWSQKGRGDDEF